MMSETFFGINASPTARVILSFTSYLLASLIYYTVDIHILSGILDSDGIVNDTVNACVLIFFNLVALLPFLGLSLSNSVRAMSQAFFDKAADSRVVFGCIFGPLVMAVKLLYSDGVEEMGFFEWLWWVQWAVMPGAAVITMFGKVWDRFVVRGKSQSKTLEEEEGLVEHVEDEGQVHDLEDLNMVSVNHSVSNTSRALVGDEEKLGQS
ncbi:hypothetical protein E4T39_03300 [Aureobasidium subglaciale]|nr:hypothetical protein E4T39_03300 [Aureobasidium subglaciale]